MVKPKFIKSSLSGPPGARRFFIIKREMKIGTAMVMTKMVRQSFLNFSPLVLIIRAKTIPKKKLVTVAKTAQIKVQVRIGKKEPAIRPVRTLPKFEKPTQWKRLPGGRWLWSKLVKARQTI